MVQAQLRRLNPACGPNEAVLLGFDAEDLAAVVVLANPAGDARVAVIEGIGVSLPYRRCGGHVADDAMERAVDWAAERADLTGLGRVTLAGRVDERNIAGRSLLQRHQFSRTLVGEGYEEWALVIELE